MIDLRKIAKIYIIESQRDSDILVNRTEGKALSASLDLAEIPNKYYQVVSEKMLDECLSLITKEIIELRKTNSLVAPYLHFSTHGNEDGIMLTDKTFINWESLSSYIDYMNSKIGFMKHPNRPDFQISLLNLCFSVCQGYNAKKIQGDSEDNKYVFIIGPTTSVDWSDSLIAFLTFYHQVFYKQKKAKEALLQMNKAAGLDDIFNISTGKGIAFE
jgi:hypothetical protein